MPTSRAFRPTIGVPRVADKYILRHVPAHLRHLLSAESACNDGAAFPFLFIAIYLTLEQSDGYAVGEWFYISWLCEFVSASLPGALGLTPKNLGLATPFF